MLSNISPGTPAGESIAISILPPLRGCVMSSNVSFHSRVLPPNWSVVTK